MHTSDLLGWTVTLVLVSVWPDKFDVIRKFRITKIVELRRESDCVRSLGQSQRKLYCKVRTNNDQIVIVETRSLRVLALIVI